MTQNRRQTRRISANLLVDIRIDPQITIQGRVRNISEKSAFVQINSSVYMQVNDEFHVTIKYPNEAAAEIFNALARIFRIDAGEGIAIFFIKMDEKSTLSLQKLIGNNS